LIDVKSLQNNTALKVSIVDEKVSITNSPVAGSGDQLVQLLFIQATDLSAAIQIASKMPQVQAGPIEVRPLVE
jgi:hypothetical protein